MLTGTEVRKMFGVTRLTIYRYVRDGKLTPVKLSRTKYLYDEEQIFRILGQMLPDTAKVVVYARVPVGNNGKALADQVNMLTEFAAKNGLTVSKVFTDKCGSLDFSRQTRSGIFELLINASKRKVSAVVVESPDRFALIGHEIIEALLNLYKIRVIYVNRTPANLNYRHELIRDLAAVVKGLQKALGPSKSQRSGEIGSGTI